MVEGWIPPGRSRGADVSKTNPDRSGLTLSTAGGAKKIIRLFRVDYLDCRKTNQGEVVF